MAVIKPFTVAEVSAAPSVFSPLERTAERSSDVMHLADRTDAMIVPLGGSSLQESTAIRSDSDKERMNEPGTPVL